MSDTAPADVQPTAEPSFAGQVVRNSAISAAANAAGVAGAIGALVLFSKLSGRKTRSSVADNDNPMESEHTES